MKTTVRRGSAVLLAWLLLIAVGVRSPIATAQRKDDQRKEPAQSALDLTQPYAFVDAYKIDTLETELNEAAAAGYRVQASWFPASSSSRPYQAALRQADAAKFGGGRVNPRSGSGGCSNPALVCTSQSVALLKKMSGTLERVQYAVLNPWNAPELEKRLKEAGAQGFHIVPRTLAQFDGTGQIRLVMERVPDAEARYEYFVGVATADYSPKLLSYPAGGGTLQKDALEREIQRAAAGGYTLVGMLTSTEIVQGRGFFSEKGVRFGFTLIGEKAAQAASQADRYRVVGGYPGAHLQGELSAAVVDGYHVLLTSQMAEPVLFLILEKNAASSDMRDYVVVGGMDTLTLTFQLNAAATRGFRALPGFVFDEPAAAVMEKSPSAQDVVEYSLLEDLDKKEFADFAARDWSPVGVAESGTTVLLEKATGRRVEGATVAAGPSQAQLASTGTQRQLDPLRVASLQKDLNEAAAQGYRLMRMPFTNQALSVTVEKVGDPPAAYEYLLIPEKDDKKMEAALNAAATNGFRVVPGTVSTTQLVLMEKVLAGTPSPVTYRVVGATRLSTFTKELEQAKQEGGELVGTIGSGDRRVTGPHVAILERSPAK